MPTVYLTTPGVHARLERERLIVTIPSSYSADDENGPGSSYENAVHLFDIERVFLGERCSLTIACLAELLRRDIPVLILGTNDRVLGLCQPPAPNYPSRMLQYRALEKTDLRLALASATVEAKILNQRRVLQRLASNRPDAEITPLLLRMKQIAQDAVEARSLDTLRGIEGVAAGRYFEIYGSFFPESAPFERRSRRPPHNAVNAILSYGYTVLTGEAEAMLHATGLDPAAGFFHELAERRPSLALDLIEPYRAPVADAIAIDLISHGTLQAKKHFEDREGGVYMNNEGRRRFFVAYERRMERDFTSTQHGQRTTLRRELERAALNLRRSFVEGEMMEPFLMP